MNMRVITSDVLVTSYPFAKVAFTARVYRCTVSYRNDEYQETYINKVKIKPSVNHKVS